MYTYMSIYIYIHIHMCVQTASSRSALDRFGLPMTHHNSDPMVIILPK